MKSTKNILIVVIKSRLGDHHFIEEYSVPDTVPVPFYFLDPNPVFSLKVRFESGSGQP